jgi:hypothetical protein
MKKQGKLSILKINEKTFRDRGSGLNVEEEEKTLF